MDDSSRDRLTSAIGDIRGDEFAAFVTDLWTALGWDVGPAPDGTRADGAPTTGGEYATDVLAVRRRDDARFLVRSLDDGRDVDADELRRLIDDARDVADLDGAAVVTPGGTTGDLDGLSGSENVEVVDLDALKRIVRERDVIEPVLEHADPGGGDLGAGFGDEPLDGDGSSVEEEGSSVDEDASPASDEGDGEPAVFSKVMWRVGPGSVADLPPDERATHVEGIVEHALDPSVSESALLDPPGPSFPLPLANYLEDREQPVFLFEEPVRGVTLRNRGIEETPDEAGRTLHLVTNRRILSVVGREDDVFTLNVPLSAVESVSDDPATFDGAIEIDLGDDTCRLPVHHGLASDVVDRAIRYVERGPHPWKGAEVTRGSIQDPATFGDPVG